MEIEREARIELGEAARELKNELNDVVIEMNSFRRATQQSIADGIEEIAKLTQEKLIKVSENVGEVAKGVISKLDTSFSSFTQNAEQMDHATFKTVGEIENLVRRLESIEVPSNILKESMEPAVKGIGEIVEEMKLLAKEDEKYVRRFGRMIGKAADTTELLNGRIGALNEQMGPLEGIVSRITEMGDSLKNIEEESGALLDRIKRNADEHEAILARIREIAEKNFQDANENLVRMLRQQGDAIGDLLAKAQDNAEAILQNTKTNAEDQAKVLDALVVTNTENLDLVRNHNQALESEFKRSRDITIQVQAALTSMSALLVKKLSDPRKKGGQAGTA